MERKFSNFFGLLGEKAKDNGNNVVTAFEETRGGMPKSYIPNFFYKPPFGYPRFEDLFYYRELAASVYVDMCETAIIDEVTSIQWVIVAEDRDGNEVPGKEKEVEIVDKFFNNPNTNPGESWETIIRMMLPDLLELNSGILIKTFNAFGEMVEIVARDGSAFTKNPDIYGMYTDRADLILVKNILNTQELPQARNDLNFGTPLYQGFLTEGQARDEAAYFQYGFNTAARPVPFGKREIVWIEKKVRTDNLYGRSSMGVLAKTVQTLIYAVEHNFDFFADNSIPPGILGIEGLSTNDMKAFGEQWVNSQKKKDDLGNWKKAFHKLTMVNKIPHFERLSFTNQELQIIEQQKWWAKLVWAAFGLTATELGFTEDAKGSANQIVQSSIAKKRIIYPILRLLEYYINTQIIPEFGFEGIRYKYKIFDVDDEAKKWKLYADQTEAGLKTVNEIRNSEGLDPVDWGDEPPKNWSANQGMNINMTDPNQTAANQINQDAQNQRDQMTGKPGDKKKDKKALDTQTPLTLRPGEEMDKKLKKIIIDLLDKNKEKIFEILESQTRDEPLIRIKGIDDIPGMIKKIFAAFTIKKVSDAIIKEEYLDGWDYSEKQLDENLPVNEKALDFLQEHTFDNIKGMTEEIANDLKAELQRGIINGEGITKLKARVEKVFNVGKNRAEMIARTETNRAENQGRLLAMKESDIKMKKWLSITYDLRTSEISKAMGRKYGTPEKAIPLSESFSVNVSGKEISGTAPPFHISDRDVIVFELE